MITWIKEIRWGKAMLSALIYTVLATIVHQVEALLTMRYYLMPEYFGVWSRLMMPTNGPPPPEFFVTSLVFTFCSGLSLCIIYYYIRHMLPKDQKKRMLMFADLMIGTSFIFFTLPSYLLFNLPPGLLVSWFVSSFIILVSASAVMVKLLK